MCDNSKKQNYHFNEEQKIYINSMLLKGKTPKQIKEEWPFERRSPSISKIYYLKNKVSRTGSVDQRKGQGHPVTIINSEMEENIENCIKKNYAVSLRNISRRLKISYSSVRKYLIRNRFRSYKIKNALDLTTKNFEQRIEFSDWYSSLSDKRKNLIWWSDESFIRLSSFPNRNNNRIWRKKSPSFLYRKKYSKKGIMVWCAINSEGDVLHHIFKENVTGNSYKQMLKSKFPLMKMNRYWFMQDGAGPHYSNVVKDMLNKRYPRRWIGRGSCFQSWPAKSPDLTPCDFFLWGYLKNRIQQKQPRTRQNLINIFKYEIEHIPKKFIQRACSSVEERMKKLQETKGDQIN